MAVQRLTPAEFKAEYRSRGWAGKDLAAHWGSPGRKPGLRQ